MDNKVDKKKYDIKSIEFLNATIDEIYQKKKHYVVGKELTEFKGYMSLYFVQLERIFKYVYYSDFVVDLEQIDLSLFKEQFPYVYNTFYGKSYEKTSNNKTVKLNGVVYYTKILDNLRNINLHGVISTNLANVFRVNQDFIEEFFLFSDKVSLLKEGVLTIAGMLTLIMPLLDQQRLQKLIKYIFQNWCNPLFDCEYRESYQKQELLLEELNNKFGTNYEVEIRKSQSSGKIIEDIFGRETKNLNLNKYGDVIEFVLDLSSRLKSPRYKVEGFLFDNNQIVQLLIRKGSNIGIYFENDYTLNINNVELFCEYCCQVPCFLSISYLYQNKISIFDDTTYNGLNLKMYKKLNNPKFFRDKDIRILCYGNQNADIRELNKVVSENLLRLFLDFEESIVFNNNIKVYSGFSKFKEIVEVFDTSKEISNKLIACRNFCSHEGILDNFHYVNNDVGYTITLPFICKTIKEFIDYLIRKDYKKQAYWMQKGFHNYVLNNVFSCKYKRIFEASAQLFRCKREKIVDVCNGIKKSLGAVKNSALNKYAESELLNLDGDKYFFYIPQQLFETPDDKYYYKKLILIRILEKDLEVRGINTATDVLEFFRTPNTNFNKITKNGDRLTFQLIEEEDNGIMKIQSYKIKK